MEFTRYRFLALTVLAHMGAVAFVMGASLLDWGAALFLFVVFTLVSTVFYHRLISHSSWAGPKWLERLGVFIGVFTLTGTPLTRTAVHRLHHRYTDEAQDPHSPVNTSLLKMYLPQLKETQLDLRLVKDVLRNPYWMWLHRWYIPIIAFSAITCAFVSVQLLLIWAMAATLTWMNIFICNTACHWGGELRDNPVLAVLTFGEGHHKYHHEHPTDSQFGAYDPGYLLIKSISWLTKN